MGLSANRLQLKLFTLARVTSYLAVRRSLWYSQQSFRQRSKYAFSFATATPTGSTNCPTCKQSSRRWFVQQDLSEVIRYWLLAVSGSCSRDQRVILADRRKNRAKTVQMYWLFTEKNYSLIFASSECYRVYRVQISHASLISTFWRCSDASFVQLLKTFCYWSRRNEM